MCNGFSSRASEGGALAVLRGQGRHTGTPFNAKITLHNPVEDISIPTKATFLLEKGGRMPCLNSCCLIIHQDGNLTSEVVASKPPLHYIPFDFQGTDNCEISLSSRLDLGVGGQGIIGRKMTLMNSRQVIAEGIVGWN
ncbi:hypothetical protein TWF694_003236 [Orbilia ellipsospora]|uniref:Uncharacterized protein n=1 Tax=Orbilia ellipsospora TaxID=2528407 RepID=A0AAV9X1W8_9PEZI